MTMKVMKYIVLPTRNATKKGYVRTMAEDLTFFYPGSVRTTPESNKE